MGPGSPLARMSWGKTQKVRGQGRKGRLGGRHRQKGWSLESISLNGAENRARIQGLGEVQGRRKQSQSSVKDWGEQVVIWGWDRRQSLGSWAVGSLAHQKQPPEAKRRGPCQDGETVRTICRQPPLPHRGCPWMLLAGEAGPEKEGPFCSHTVPSQGSPSLYLNGASFLERGQSHQRPLQMPLRV